MRIAVSGGHGRLGRRLCKWLKEQGHTVIAPPRSAVDWTDSQKVSFTIRDCDRVIALASWTNVTGAIDNPGACVRDTVLATQVTIDSCCRLGRDLRWIGSDYVLSLYMGQKNIRWYTASKAVAEQLVLLADQKVIRVCFLTPEQVAEWKWVDGLSRSCRIWVEDLIPQLGSCVLSDDTDQIVNLGGDPVTLPQLLRARYPDHPALNRIITSPSKIEYLSRNTRPRYTVWES